MYWGIIWGVTNQIQIVVDKAAWEGFYDITRCLWSDDHFHEDALTNTLSRFGEAWKDGSTELEW